MRKKDLRLKRKRSIRKNISGTDSKPRLTVYRSNRFIYAQAINDLEGKTVAAATSQKMKETGVKAGEKIGKEIAELLLGLKIETVVFDRNGYKFHGAIKALADGARSAGLKF